MGNRAQPDEKQKAIIGFFKHTRGLRFISKKTDRDKDWVNKITEDCLVPKIFARHVLMPSAVKKTAKAVTVVSSAGAQISSAGAQFESSVSNTASDFKEVRSVGSPQQKTWGGLQAERTLKGGSSTGDGTAGDLILKGAKKLKEKVSEKKNGEEDIN